MSKRKDVQDRDAVSLSMPQPLAVEINPMNHKTANTPASCENDFLFRHSPLLPKIINPRSSHPSIDLLVKRWTPVTNPYRYKSPNKPPYPPACRLKKQGRSDWIPIVCETRLSSSGVILQLRSRMTLIRYREFGKGADIACFPWYFATAAKKKGYLLVGGFTYKVLGEGTHKK